MKLVRLALAGAVVASALAVTHASAAPPCKLIGDGAGDSLTVPEVDLGVGPVTPAAGPNVPSTDILSADIASDKKRITAVIRVAKLAAMDPSAPTGQHWALGFVADGQKLTLYAESDPLGNVVFGASKLMPTGINEPYGAQTGKFDTAKNEVRITADLALFADVATIKTGTKITELEAGAGTFTAVNYPPPVFEPGTLLSLSVPRDVASTPKAYVSGSKNCVTVNK